MNAMEPQRRPQSSRGYHPSLSELSGGDSRPSSAGGSRRRDRDKSNENFKVVIRVRPPLDRELQGAQPFKNIVAVERSERRITVSDNLPAVTDQYGSLISGTSTNHSTHGTHTFTFDHVYAENASQRKVYENTARAVVESSLLGYNATIFAYGQTGTGKTYTMEGSHMQGSEERGIIPRAIEQIFSHIQQHASPTTRFLVRASYLQIYNEQVSDLLRPERTNLQVREDKKKGVFVEGLSECVVKSPEEIYMRMQQGARFRATGATNMNELSSRSHAVFIIIVEQSDTAYMGEDGRELTTSEVTNLMHAKGIRRDQAMSMLETRVKQSFKVGKLNLVDLAGSERVRQSGATGQRLEESKSINQSLASLGNVISALTDTTRTHVPYRDSKLTRILEDSLGGNCKTTMMAMISPAHEALVETVSTLKFANRAKNIKNEAKVNEDVDQKSLLRKYERELKRLREALNKRSQNVVDTRRLLELEEMTKRAEADKMAAIKALEARSLEFMREKDEKRRLEERIAMLTSQMIRGEGSMSGHPYVQSMMKEHQERMRRDYAVKLAEIEKERETIEEEKAQVDRYKQLLLKQRDIMIALTQRLNERDEQIMALQDELDAYDRHQKELEEKLDEKTAEIIRLERFNMEVDAAASQPQPIHQNGDVSSKELQQQVSDLTAVVARQRAAMAELSAKLSETEQRDDSSNQNLKDRLSMILESEMDLSVQRATISRDIAHELTHQILSRLQEDGITNGVDISLDHSDVVPWNDSRQHANTAELEHQLTEALEASVDLRNRLENTAQRADEQELAFGMRINQLSQRCDILVKERQAIQTIVEKKMGTLISSLVEAVTDMAQLQEVQHTSAFQAVIKDIANLQKLVNASVGALRHAAAQDQERVQTFDSMNGEVHSNQSSPRPMRPVRQAPAPPTPTSRS